MKAVGIHGISINCWPKPLHRGARVVLTNKQLVDKLVTIYEREKDQTDLPNWLDNFLTVAFANSIIIFNTIRMLTSIIILSSSIATS